MCFWDKLWIAHANLELRFFTSEPPITGVGPGSFFNFNHRKVFIILHLASNIVHPHNTNYSPDSVLCVANKQKIQKQKWKNVELERCLHCEECVLLLKRTWVHFTSPTPAGSQLPRTTNFRGSDTACLCWHLRSSAHTDPAPPANKNPQLCTVKIMRKIKNGDELLKFFLPWRLIRECCFKGGSSN